MTRGKLPLGIQNFEELHKGGYLYADKTDTVSYTHLTLPTIGG